MIVIVPVTVLVENSAGDGRIVRVPARDVEEFEIAPHYDKRTVRPDASNAIDLTFELRAEGSAFGPSYWNFTGRQAAQIIVHCRPLLSNFVTVRRVIEAWAGEYQDR